MKLFIDISEAFYKTMFLNALNKKEKIMVAYFDDPHRPFRGTDFLNGEKEYDFISIKGGLKKKWRSITSLIKNAYDEVIVGSYDRITCWLAVFLSPKKKNGVIIESTFRETRKKGVRVYLKRLFFKRVSTTYVCGKSHADLVKAFGFTGRIVDIGTVGFIRRVPQPSYEERKEVKRFLYVGRLIAVKNLEWLIKQFAKHPELELTIIGTGDLEDYLKSIASSNVKFLGTIPNSKLFEYYQKADVFVLPSYYETYGLVVEEALNNGTPVLLSHMVGCQDNLVVANDVGLVYTLDDINDFEKKLAQIRDIEIYNRLRENVSKMDFEKLEEDMVNAFVN